MEQRINSKEEGPVADDGVIGTLDLLLPLCALWRWLLWVPLVAVVLAAGATYLVDPLFTARTSMLPPRQQNSVGMALGSLGGLAGLAGGAMLRSPADQYVAMLSSQTVADRLVDQFDLMKVYAVDYRFMARKRLADSTRIVVDRRDGLITIEVDDTNPQRAADIANAYVDRLRELTDFIAVNEAQERRQFFERELATARDGLARAQAELQASGITGATLRAEPKAAAEEISGVRAALALAEIQLRMVRRTHDDSTPEVQQQLARLSGLRDQLRQLEQRQSPDESNYVDKYREFKYREGIFEIISKQFELARLDEQREGALIQVVDVATVPEWKSSPKRAKVALSAGAITFVLMAFWLMARQFWRLSLRDPVTASKAEALRLAMRSRRVP